ncbi:MAG: carbon storage regulator CsrA [Peptococcaceae bacterium]|nr:carbon storage regulator CsrA [Peptococcaceae bacterium]
MLVLARKKGQSVIIGNDVRVCVVEVSGETVRLGIEAPAGMEIFRSEIYRQLREENAVSVTTTEEALGFLKKNLAEIKTGT